MSNRLKSFLFFIFIGTLTYAQTSDTTSPKTPTPTYTSPYTATPQSASSSESTEFIFKPTIGLGSGMFSFFGDLYQKHFQSPQVSRIGYELNVTQALNSYLQFNFNVLYGNLGANERFVNSGRNLNFESRIFLGGVQVIYDFGNFLPADREASPYLLTGFETFEFTSKTDLYDAKGNRYYYWSDNSIRNMSETDPNAENAVEIKRDYTYETDLQKLNRDGFGKYPEHSFAIPVGIGVRFKLNDYLNFNVGTTMHFTMTDYIDGVTANSTENRAGNKSKDRFMMTSFGLSYNFGITKGKHTPEEENFFKDNGADFLALENEDQDGDGVIDFLDSCQGTPVGVPVDVKGCPLDDDEDAVPTYKDVEINSRVDAYVDEKGLELTDSVIAYRYNFYMDSVGAFAKVEVHDHNGALIKNRFLEKEYAVELGIFKTGLPPELMTQFLSIDDISTTVLDDSTTVYTAGNFSGRQEAETRKQELLASGLTNIKVVYKQRGTFHDPEDDDAAGPSEGKEIVINPKGNTGPEKNTGSKNVNKNEHVYRDGKTARGIIPGEIKTPGMVFRVQLGAYRKPLSNNVFPEVSDLIEIKTDDSLYKYMTGTFKTIDGAAKHKATMLLKGYEGAFITAYKDGNRISLKKAGATPINAVEDITEVSDHAPISGVTKKLVVYKVQVGAFKNNVPAQQAKFEKIKITKESSKGFNRYLTGEFSDYASAAKYKDDLLSSNTVAEAFVIAYFNGQIISLQEAAELLKN
jgi:hypothetical protein